MNLSSRCESLLFVSSHPISLQKLAQLTETTVGDVEQALKELGDRYQTQAHGLRLLWHAKSVQLVTAPDAASLVAQFLKDELNPELTRPALETLTIIAYRGPITKSELDTIRGVNCSLILRNLLIKGLIGSSSDHQAMTTSYQVTFDFLRSLGVERAEDLPEYAALSRDVHLEKLLATAEQKDENTAAEESGQAQPMPEVVV